MRNLSPSVFASLSAAILLQIVASEDKHFLAANSLLDEENLVDSSSSSGTSSPTLQFVELPKNYTNLRVGDQVKLKCEVRGDPAADNFKWYVNEKPLKEEKGRVRIKNGGSRGTRWSQARFKSVQVMDTGYYRCRASNAAGDTVHAESFLKVHLATKWEKEHEEEEDKHLFSDDDDDTMNTVKITTTDSYHSRFLWISALI